MATDFAPHNMTNNSTPSPYFATASTTWGGSGAYQAFDSPTVFNNGHYWLTNGVSTGWLQIDLGLNIFINLDNYSITVNTIPEPNRAPKDWTMKGSVDGINFDVLDTVTNQTAWGSGETRNFVCDVKGSYYRYFRIDVTANNGDSYLQIGELYLYGDNAGIPGSYLRDKIRSKIDLSLYSNNINSVQDFSPHNMSDNTTPFPYVASASSEFGGVSAYQAFDGGIGGGQYWLTNGTSTGWLQIDLGKDNTWKLNSYKIAVNTIPEPNRAPKDWTIKASNDGVNFDIISTITNQTAWGSGEIRTFLSNNKANAYRYFRVDITANNGDTYLQIAELYLFGIMGNSPNTYLKDRQKSRLNFSNYLSA